MHNSDPCLYRNVSMANNIYLLGASFQLYCKSFKCSASTQQQSRELPWFRALGAGSACCVMKVAAVYRSGPQLRRAGWWSGNPEHTQCSLPAFPTQTYTPEGRQRGRAGFAGGPGLCCSGSLHEGTLRGFVSISD